MYLIDTHAHFYEEVFLQDVKKIVNRCSEFNIGKVLMPNIDRNSFPFMLEMAEKYPDLCFPMLGIHPCYVKENFKYELLWMEKQLLKIKWTAIGEIGLDLYRETQYLVQQIEAFQTQLEWSLKLQLPVSIHSRNATLKAIEVLKKYKNIQGVFHCFTESKELAKQILDLGFYIGIGGVLTYKNAGIAEVLKYIPLDKIILETDAPYLAPHPLRGKTNEPAYLHYIAEKMALILNKPLQDIILQTTQNAEKLFFNKY